MIYEGTQNMNGKRRLSIRSWNRIVKHCMKNICQMGDK